MSPTRGAVLNELADAQRELLATLTPTQQADSPTHLAS